MSASGLTLARTWGGGGGVRPPPFEWEISMLVRYNLFLEVMLGCIFAKFDIVPKAQLWPNHFETCSVQYRHRTLQISYLRFSLSLTSGQVDFVACQFFRFFFSATNRNRDRRFFTPPPPPVDGGKSGVPVGRGLTRAPLGEAETPPHHPVS